MANMFTAGIILSTALVHLLGDAAESETNAYPWPGMLVGVGYGVMLSIEQWAIQDGDHSGVQDKGAHVPLATVENGEAHVGGSREAPSKHDSHNHAEGSAIAATIALVVHSIGDGASMALQDSTGRLAAIAGAIVFHKFFAAAALGTVLLKAFRDKEPKSKTIVYGLLFALTTPIVILAVVASGNAFPDDSVAIGRVTAVCAGSLLYAGIHEILPLGLENHNVHLAPKLLLFWVGYSIMSVLGIWA